MNDTLQYTVQVGDFLRIHCTKIQSRYLPNYIASSFGIKATHLIVYPRVNEHLVKSVEYCVYINFYEDTFHITKSTRRLISDTIDEYKTEYLSRQEVR